MSPNWFERSWGNTWSHGCLWVHLRLSYGVMARAFSGGTLEFTLGLGIIEIEARWWPRAP